MADQRKTFAVARRINQLKTAEEGAPPHRSGPIVQVVLADPVCCSAAAQRVAQRQPKTQGVRGRLAIYCEYSSGKAGDGRQGYKWVIQGDKPAEAARPALDDLELNEADGLGADRRTDAC